MSRKNIVAVSVGCVVLIGVALSVLLSPKSPRPASGMQTPAVVEAAQPAPEVAEAEQLRAQGKLLEAKAVYQKAMEGVTDTNRLIELQDKLGRINIQILLSPIIDECSTTYTVKPKDTLSVIARTHGTTVNLIKRTNGLASDLIRIGQELKVSTCPFSIAVDKSQNVLLLKRKGEFFKAYTVSTGKDNSSPVGTFKIVNKLEDPTWYKTGAVIPPDSPDNILGTRWMGFDLESFGIHGTTEPEKLGTQVTLGCVRMKNEEVEELYDIVPVGTEVTIVD